MSLALGLKLLSLCCGFAASCLAFINNFKSNLKTQLTELIKRGSNNYKEIRIDQRFFAYVLFQINKTNWWEVFDNTTKGHYRLEFDKTYAVRMICWIILSSMFVILLIFIE